MEIPGGAAFAAARNRAARVIRAPAFGLVAIAPLVFLGAAGGSSPTPWNAVSDANVTTMAAVAGSDGPTPMVVAARRAPDPFRVANASISAPPPAFVMNSVGSLRIPAMALNAYRNAEQMMASAYPGCGISWNLLAGIGRIESMHANGGATDARGNPVQPILGPTLDGTLAGNEVIVQNVQAGRVTYARAMGPMQFLPGTWARYASDGDGDGKADVQNLYDSTLAAARYLCSGNLNLRDRNQVLTAILRYNNSAAYAQNVLGWAAAYATGVVPVDLPPISGSAPIGDGHLDANPEGLGPGMPLNAAGAVASQRVAFGTSGHRGVSFDGSFNEAHVLAITQAICHYRQGHGIDGPLFIGIDTHALSGPAFQTALEVLAANEVQVMISKGGEYTPTPAVSHAVLGHNRRRNAHFADGIVISPSHNPPDSGGFKYNPPNGGPADTDVTKWIENQANAMLAARLREVLRIPLQQARRAATTREHDYMGNYVADLKHVIDFDAIRGAGVRMGVDPLGGCGRALLGTYRRHLWHRVEGGQRNGGSHVQIHVPGLGRTNSHGPILTVRHAAADPSQGRI